MGPARFLRYNFPMVQTGNGGNPRTRIYSTAEFQTLARKRVEEALGYKWEGYGRIPMT